MPSPSAEYRELLIGCGHAHTRRKRLRMPGFSDWKNLTTLDYNPDCKPDVEWDLTRRDPLPFEDDSFDEIHAYHVLEHIGQQGDFLTFFRQFEDYWRVLRAGGFFCGIVPQGRLWTWGDPGHTRVINQGTLVFLSRREYIKQIDTPETKTDMTDYRRWYKADYDIVHVDENSDENEFRFVLQSFKPARAK